MRHLIRKETDFVVLTEVRADRRAAAGARIKWGLKVSHSSLHDDPHGGVVILSKPEHKPIPGSFREATTPGHVAAAVYDVRGTRIVVVGVYGESASNDRASVVIMDDLRSILTELKHIYHTQEVIIAGDFNVTIHANDSNNPNHNSKPRTRRALRNIIDDHNLTDLAMAANRPWHTWFRQGDQGQSSRIDLILTSMTVTNPKVTTTLLFLDHVYLEASFGPARSPGVRAMKDYILGCDEFLLRSHDIIDEHVAQYATSPLQGHSEQEEADAPSPQEAVDLLREFNIPETGHTALHSFNTLIQKLQSLHGQIAHQKARAQANKLQEPSQKLLQLKRTLRGATSDEVKTTIQDQICDIQKTIQDDLEAKDQAAQMRISHFYRSRTGKMVPETFTCVKESRRGRAIHRLEHEGREVTCPEEIVDIMQKWYERTAEDAPQQQITLDQFLQEQDLQLPRLSPEDCSELDEEFTPGEVLQAIKDAKAVSAPGPSGQTISFYKLLFMHVPNLMTQALNQLVYVPHLSTDDALHWIQERKVIYIPKTPNPVSPGDYRPLSMLEVLYKIPARILARRLTTVLPKLVGPHQHGFMPKQGIQEPSVLATHLIEEANKQDKPLQLVSFDIE